MKVSKTKLAKNLGISRPTLYKKIRNGESVTSPELDTVSQTNCVKFSAHYNTVSPHTLEEILETLQDFGFLTQEGIRFRKHYWELFIKE